MQISHFIFVEGLKTFALVFVALLAVKIISAMRLGIPSRRAAWLKRGLYFIVIVLGVVGASAIGNDVAAEFYYHAALQNADRGQLALEYLNALRAVRLRQGNLSYWQALDAAKVNARQFQSVLNDEPAVRRLSGGKLGDADEIRYATCRYFLGQYEQALQGAQLVVQRSPYYPVSYAIEGLSYTALRQYPAAEKAYLTLLGIVPTDVDAVRGLARAYYLAGNPARALSVLDATRHYSFSSAARKQFENLKALYAQ